MSYELPSRFAGLARVALVLIVAGASQIATLGAVINAASCSQADFTTAYNSAASGDTIQLPAGTNTWTSQFVMAKSITIKGSGYNTTRLVNGINQSEWHGKKAVFYVTAGGTWRISGIYFDGQHTSGGKGIVVVGGIGRVDNCFFWRCDDRAIQTFTITGLIDHCQDVDSWAFAGHYADQYTAWTRPLNIGTTNCWVVEDCYVRKTGAYYAPVVDDGGWGAKYMFRFNVVSNLGSTSFDYALDAHGNQGSPFGHPADSIAGVVFLESYNNVLSMGTANRGMILRGGTQVHYNNRLTATGGNMVTYNSVFVLSEEDGYRYGSPIVTNWPSYQGITNSYFWGNTYNGGVGNPRLEFDGEVPCMTNTGCGAPWYSDRIFIQQNRDYWLSAPSTNFYTPLSYPHPRIVAENDPPIPATFALSSPTHLAADVSVQPTLQWADTSGETGYRVFVATDYFFANVIVDATLAANTASYSVPGGLLSPSTTYYWKVWATSANGVNSSANAPYAFTTDDGSDPVPGSIQFSASSYSVQENGGSLTITAQRVGGSDGAVTAAYATSNGTAISGVNYTTASGTLSWADGDSANKTFNITILVDGVYPGDKVLSVALSNPTGGATLGSPSSADVTIVNTDSAPPQPPLMSGLTFLASEGLITTPARTNANGWVYSPNDADQATNGVVEFRVTIPTTTNYLLKVTTVAQTTANNSYWVEWDDATPTIPYTAWHIATLTGASPEERVVSWQGTGVVTSEFPTNSWNLTAGVHTLRLWPRERNTFIDQITVEEIPTEDIPQQTVAWVELGVTGLAGTTNIFNVLRSVGTNDTITVDYATANGTAVAGVDYTAVTGTLTLTNGQTQASVSVPLTSNSTPGPNKSFTLLLSNPVGCDIGSPSVTTGYIEIPQGQINPPVTGVLEFRGTIILRGTFITH